MIMRKAWPWNDLAMCYGRRPLYDAGGWCV